MKVKCVEDVIMKCEKYDQPAFTKGKEYKAYKTKLRDGWGYRQVIRAVNDYGERHIIRVTTDDSLNEFFERHFVEIPKCEQG